MTGQEQLDEVHKIDWSILECRHGCSAPVVGLFHAPYGCWCFRDVIQALCAQHAVKGMQNNDMRLLLARLKEPQEDVAPPRPLPSEPLRLA